MPTLQEALAAPSEASSLTLPAARYEFVFDVTAPIRSPEYAGSMIRGAFGRALRRTACMTRQKDCKACPLYRTCPYTAIFETPPPLEPSLQKFSQIPNPYVIEPPSWGKHDYEAGERIVFNVVLWDKARDQLALIIYALERAFSHDVGHGKAKLVSVSLVHESGKTPVYAPGIERIIDHDTDTAVEIPAGDVVRLRLETPMRIQINGRPLGPEALTPRALLMTVVRRMSLLAACQTGSPLEVDFTQLVQDSEAVRLRPTLGWKDWTRYSSRQQQKMSLGGVVGSLELSGVSPPLKVFLAAGTLMHAGKNASFGLGRYDFERAA